MPGFGGDFPERALYEDAVRCRVCAQCIDFGAQGICHTPDPEGCAIFRYLPELVGIADQMHELKVEPYVRAVRERICIHCKNQSAGRCNLRGALDCGLDRYLPLVLEAIEEVQARII